MDEAYASSEYDPDVKALSAIAEGLEISVTKAGMVGREVAEALRKMSMAELLEYEECGELWAKEARVAMEHLCN